MFSQVILHWYQHNKRDLPWRHINDPYIIWLSEIIMQQTRVEQGTPYFERFLAAYPTVQDFAAATESDILHLWQGLGYYSRGRNMHKTAIQVMEMHGGKFPSTYAELLTLKGIGPYSAAAIASFAFAEPVAVVDGNVYRVLSRYFGIETAIDSTIGKKEFAAAAQSLLPKENVADYNQGIMEFGALQCKPAQPNCSDCPLNTSCIALQNNSITTLPVKSKKQRVTNRYFNYFIVTDADANIYLQKRIDKDIWQHLYQFPLWESPADFSETEVMQTDFYQSYIQTLAPIITHISSYNKHLLSHQRIFARFWHLEVAKLAAQPNLLIVEKKSIKKFALPQLLNRYLQQSFYVQP